jgi:hypothetical protein
MERLNLGSGHQKIQGFKNLDRIFGDTIYPLRWGDGSVDEIRASHVLEHFKHNDSQQVVNDWVRALKPGGILRIAVPDFAKVVELYREGGDPNLAGYVLGGQQDDNDYHLAIFDEQRLKQLMTDAGLVDIGYWESEVSDCASYPISLNLAGRKPEEGEVVEPETIQVSANVGALMSVPRLGWQDNFGAVFMGLKSQDPAMPFDIPLFKFGGAFWEMGMQRGIAAMIEQGIDWIICIDYDTVFTRDDIKELMRLAALYPQADAIVPIQAKRNNEAVLFSMVDAAGNPRCQVPAEEFESDLVPIHTGHFGLTLLKSAAIKKLKKPWFWSQPTADGEWNENRIDADIYFWIEAKKQGFKAFQANHIRIGHLQVVVSWVNEDFKVVHQYLNNYQDNGKPDLRVTSALS